jgi:hypothetical protein
VRQRYDPARGAIVYTCPRGHEYDERTAYRYPSGRLACRTCRREDARRYWRRRKGRADSYGLKEPAGRGKRRAEAADLPTRLGAREKTPENQTAFSGEPESGAPEGLSERSQALWRSVTEGWELEDHHRELLIEACHTLDRIDQCRRLLDAEGVCYADRWGRPRVHPLVDAERRARALFKDLMRSLDLRPEPGID